MLDVNRRQMYELARPIFFYSCFNLQALTSIADFGDEVGMDMWHFKTERNKSLRQAINYLIPAVKGEKRRYSTLKKLIFLR